MTLKNKKKTKKIVKKLTKKTVKKAIKRVVKKSVKKIAKKKNNQKKLVSKNKPAKKSPKSEGNLIGLITHYFPHVQAAVIKLKKPIIKGDTLEIKGHTTDLTQIVSSMQIDRVEISSAKKGDEIGLQVSSRVRQGDKVYKI